MIIVLGSPNLSMMVLLAQAKISTVPTPYALRHIPIEKI